MARQRLLEGFLLRLAAARDADAFALRGGMLVQHWCASRPVHDVDLACALPYRPRDLRERLREMLRHDAGDGVVFGAERIRLDQVVYNGRAGLKLFAAGRVDGAFAEITADIMFHVDVWPAATRGVFVAERGSAALWTCAHEMVIATKLGVIGQLGPRTWRPKDLADIWIALRRFPSIAVLGDTLERRLGSAHAGDEILTETWWHDANAAMRWGRYVARQPHVPDALDAVVAEIRDTLAPFARTP